MMPVQLCRNAMPSSINYFVYKPLFVSFLVSVNYPSCNKLRSLKPFLCFTFLYTNCRYRLDLDCKVSKPYIMYLI